MTPRLLLLGGPTAVGKSAVASILAERLGGEIISVDSMQVYRGLDIGTAKPAPEERARIRHHLIDVVDLTEAFDAAQFCRHAQNAISEIRARGRVPILCGGTGLYFRALLRGLGTSPPSDPLLRAELEAQPLARLCLELERLDPVLFATIDRQNPRRVVRALEVIRLTGQSYSSLRSTWSEAGPLAKGAMFVVLQRDVAALGRIIEQRVDAMFAAGLIAETTGSMSRGLLSNRTVLQAIGYRQVVEFLQGVRSLDATVELVKLRTRQFAKRQMTWFRREPMAEWLNLQDESAAEVASHVEKKYQSVSAAR